LELIKLESLGWHIMMNWDAVYLETDSSTATEALKPDVSGTAKD